MPTTPDGLNITTLHGKFVEPNSSGTPLKGTLTFTPNPAVITFPTEDVIVTGTETATLDDITGEFTIDLISTDQAGENPTGWTYSVTEKLVGQKQRTYTIALPYNLGVTVELSDITPTDAAPTYIPVVGPTGAPGLITSINGHSTSSVTLTAADVNAVATSARGAANGVASLDASTKIPVGQIPDISATYITTARIGAASGVAGLTAGGLVTSTQLDLASGTPTAIADTGAVGTATQLARADHTHSGVSLAGNQSPAGNKTWTGSAYFTGTEVGIGVTTSLGGRVDIRTASAGLTVLALQNTNGASTASILKVTGDTSTAVLMTGLVTGDAQNRFAIRSTGQIEMGSGAAARDVNFYRSGVGVLNSSGQLAVDAAAPTAAAHLTRKDYTDAADALAVHLAGTETISGAKTFSATTTLNGTVAVNGSLNLTGVSELISRTLATDSAYRSQITGDTNSRLIVSADGKHTWGSGSATGDAVLYRNGVGILKTDTAFQVGTDLTVTGNINSATNLTMGAETPYTPVWGGTGVALGNGTIKGSYTLIGKLCICFVQVVFGTTSTFGSSSWTITLPFTAAGGPSGSGVNWAYSGAARGHDANWYAGTVSVLTGGTNARIYSNNSSPATEWAAGVPTTWVAHNTAYFDFTLVYMIA